MENKDKDVETTPQSSPESRKKFPPAHHRGSPARPLPPPPTPPSPEVPNLTQLPPPNPPLLPLHLLIQQLFLRRPWRKQPPLHLLWHRWRCFFTTTMTIHSSHHLASPGENKRVIRRCHHKPRVVSPRIKRSLEIGFALITSIKKAN